jgi:hypothetical protein
VAAVECKCWDTKEEEEELESNPERYRHFLQLHSSALSFSKE